MTDTNVLSSATSDDGFSVSSTFESQESLDQSMAPDPQPEGEAKDDKPADPKLSKAASALGKAGGEAAAAKRAEARAAQDAEDGAGETPEPPAAGETPEQAASRGKPRHDAKARMLEATRKEAEAKRELERERSERARLSAELEALKSGKTAPAKEEAKPAAADAEPQVEDYERYEDFVRAQARHEARQEFRERQKEAEDRRAFEDRHQGIQRAVGTFQKRYEEAVSATPDFAERVREVAQLKPSFILQPGEQLGPLNIVADEIINSAKAPALMLHLSEHPEDLQRIAALRSPVDVQVEMRAIERGLSAASTASVEEPSVSKALPPVRPVTGASHTVSEPGDDASFDAHLAFHNARDRASARR